MKKTLMVIVLAAVALTGCVERGTGEKMGVVTKLAKQGLFCKTWEAEIVRGGLVGGSGVNGQSFHFTIENDDLAKKLQDAMENQKEVKIEYRTEVFTFCRSESDGHFLTKLEVVEPKKAEAATGGTPVTGNRLEQIAELLKVQAKILELMNKPDVK
jgi:hypothetical protein